MPDVRYVVVHTPGPRWKTGAPLSGQDGIAAHISHYRQLLDSGKLALGGPFLDERAGGMMIAAAGVTEAELAAFAAADPSVVDGLLHAHVRPWMIGMQA